MVRFIIPALVLLSGCAMSPADQERRAAADARVRDEIAAQLEGLTPGDPVQCISQRQVQSVDTYPGTFLYRVSRDKVYRNDVGSGCDADFDDVLVSRSTVAQYCSGDIIQLRSRTTGMFSGSCSLKEFTPYTAEEPAQ